MVLQCQYVYLKTNAISHIGILTFCKNEQEMVFNCYSQFIDE